MEQIPVTVDNFVRAESNRMFADLAKVAGGVNQFHHLRAPTPVDQQTVIRMNRDTLYSHAVVDLAEGAALTVPDAQGRYMSVMVLNQDHYINRVFHYAGRHELRQADFDTRYVGIAARVLVDPTDPDDIAAANDVQDGLQVVAKSAEPFVMPDYEEVSFTGVRNALLELIRFGGLGSAPKFGTKASVSPIHHLLGTAGGWGAYPRKKPATWPFSRTCRSANTRLRLGMYLWMRSGRSRCTTPLGSSSRTTEAPTA